LGDRRRAPLGARPRHGCGRPHGAGELHRADQPRVRLLPCPPQLPGPARGAPRHAGARMTQYTPHEIAALLGLPAPTPEQTAVIEAPLEPVLVVAGAGSGKTETMSARVVYLVANGLVAPDEVLGLTFTRKAAGELAERIRRRLCALASRLRADGVAHSLEEG